jgi:hypothetical protein
MDLDRTDPRGTVIAAGRERLLEHGVDALRSQLNASVLSASSPVSRDTAYRVFRGDPDHLHVSDAIVAAVSRAAHDPAWGDQQDPIRSTIAGDIEGVDDRDDVAAAVKAGLQANFERQFSMPSTPVAWLLLVSAFPGSAAWRGDPPAPECADLAAELLEHGRASYADMTSYQVNLLTLVMSALGRRPRRDVSPETIVTLLHSLHDGAVLRRMVEPDAVDPAMVAEAMFSLALSLTEEGPFSDPRRPDDERNQRVFDCLLDAAADLWRGRPEVAVEEVAHHASVPTEVATLLFPTVGDLADSLIRARVVGGGFADVGPFPDDAAVGERLLTLITALRSLRTFGDALPHVVTVVRTTPPTGSARFEDDFVDNESRLVEALDVVPDAAQLVRDLVLFASQGTPGWPTVEALLRSIGHETDTER